jgi:hypothetical protein
VRALIRIRPIEVDNRLEELGWSREELLEVVDAMVAGRNGCTENDPSSAPGWMAWKEGCRRLREIGRPKGMNKSEDGQIPWVIDSARGVRFTVSNTDEGTGVEAYSPQNRSKKGPSTDRVVSGNQRSLFDDTELEEKVVPLSVAGGQPGILVSWYLCVFSEGDEVRAEISCPVGIENGYFTGFMERLVLVGPDGDDLVRTRYEKLDQESDFYIPVSRK